MVKKFLLILTVFIVSKFCIGIENKNNILVNLVKMPNLQKSNFQLNLQLPSHLDIADDIFFEINLQTHQRGCSLDALMERFNQNNDEEIILQNLKKYLEKFYSNEPKIGFIGYVNLNDKKYSISRLNNGIIEIEIENLQNIVLSNLSGVTIRSYPSSPLILSPSLSIFKLSPEQILERIKEDLSQIKELATKIQKKRNEKIGIISFSNLDSPTSETKKKFLDSRILAEAQKILQEETNGIENILKFATKEKLTELNIIAQESKRTEVEIELTTSQKLLIIYSNEQQLLDNLIYLVNYCLEPEVKAVLEEKIQAKTNKQNFLATNKISEYCYNAFCEIFELDQEQNQNYQTNCEKIKESNFNAIITNQESFKKYKKLKSLVGKNFFLTNIEQINKFILTYPQNTDERLNFLITQATTLSLSQFNLFELAKNFETFFLEQLDPEKSIIYTSGIIEYRFNSNGTVNTAFFNNSKNDTTSGTLTKLFLEKYPKYTGLKTNLKKSMKNTLKSLLTTDDPSTGIGENKIHIFFYRMCKEDLPLAGKRRLSNEFKQTSPRKSEKIIEIITRSKETILQNPQYFSPEQFPKNLQQQFLNIITENQKFNLQNESIQTLTPLLEMLDNSQILNKNILIKISALLIQLNLSQNDSLDMLDMNLTEQLFQSV
jgi:hypothetical protein